MTTNYRDNSGRIPANAEPGEYSVAIVYNENGRTVNEYVRRWVSAGEAFKGFSHHTRSVGARIGLVTEVLLTDGGDCTNMYWVYGQGLIYPTKEAVQAVLSTKHQGQ